MTSSSDPDDTGADNSAAALQRWEALGGAWRVVSRGPAAVTVSLCRCDGGEEIDRITSDDPALLAFLGGRTSSQE
jgi:hypothetical protein